MPYIFYDTETTDVSTAFAQILQFAAIKTDDDLKEIDRFEIRCRLLPHVVPAPKALMVTGITPETLTDPTLPSHYQAMRSIHQKLVEWSPAIFIGYNSIAFDEELLRQAFFQTLHPAYLTNMNGNQRSDVMRIAHAAHIYQPNSISVPINEKDKHTFKLDQLAPINGYDHSDAHDAMADVEATIFVASLVKDRASEIWTGMSQYVNKKQVIEFVMNNACFSLSERYFSRMYSWLVTYCGRNPDYDAQLAVFDLNFDPDKYIELSVKEIIKLLEKSPKPIRVMLANRQPLLMPAEAAPGETKALSLPLAERKRRNEIVRNNPTFVGRVGEALSQRYDEKEPSPYAEKQIYDGFTGWDDQKLIEAFHEERWEDRIGLIERIQDPRLIDFANRLTYYERPDLLSDGALQKMRNWIEARVLTEEESVPWLSIPKALSKVEAELEIADREEEKFLRHIKEFLTHRGNELRR